MISDEDADLESKTMTNNEPLNKLRLPVSLGLRGIDTIIIQKFHALIRVASKFKVLRFVQDRVSMQEEYRKHL